MSEAELHLIRHRLTAGLRHKAAKGELRQGLPVGLVYDEADRVVMDPNEAVVEAIATVFRRFDELGSARQVMLSLWGDGVLIPRRRSGAKRVTWAPATYPAIHDFLTNPAYAGAFDLLAVVGAAERVVCGDTGVAHVATALAIPSVVVFGPTSPAEWALRHRPASVLWAGHTGDALADEPFRGLLEVAVADVVAALAELPPRRPSDQKTPGTRRAVVNR